MTPEQREAERVRKRDSARVHAERVRAYHREWYAANKARKDAQNAEWARQNRERASENSRKHLLSRYELTDEDFLMLADLQGGRCAICRGECSTGKRLSVDHDHDRDGWRSVRGLLCRRCNGLLGRAGDSIEWLQKAIHYLREQPIKTQAALESRKG